MARFAVLLMLAAALVATFERPDSAAAKDGSAVYVTPNAGELGTTVQLSSDFWPPNAEVKIYAGFSPTLYATTVMNGDVITGLAEPAQFYGPIATTTSRNTGPHCCDTGYTGNWNVQIPIDSSLHVPTPARPGYIIFKSVSEGASADGAVQSVGKVDEANFALVVDGRRPDGAGGIDLTVSVASGIDDQSFLFDIEPAGSQALNTFYYPYGGLMYSNHAKPFRETRERLQNGDYYVLVFPIQQRDVIGLGQFEAIPGQLCFSEPIGCNTPGRFIVKRVSVSAGTISNVEILLGKPGEAPPLQVLPVAGSGLRASHAPMLWAPIVAVAALGSGLLLSGYRLRRRGRRGS